jgi:heme exporter protein D
MSEVDERYYMLGGLALAVLVLFVYAVAAVVRYRRTLRRVRRDEAETARIAAQASYLGADAEHAQDIFAVRRTGSPAAVGLGRRAAEPTSGAVAPSAPVREAGPPVDEAAFAVVVPAEAPVKGRGKRRRVSDADIPAVRRAAEVAGAEAAIETPSAEVAPVLEPEPEVVPPNAVPEPEVAPPALEPGLETGPTEVVPAPEPVVGLPAAAGGEDSYSLSAELERLMSAAAEPAELLTPEEHAQEAPAPPPVLPEDEAALPMVFPEPSVGQALSTSAGAFVESETLPPEESGVAVPEAAAEGATDSEAWIIGGQTAGVPDYSLVAPVELHFTSGSRVGVKAGSRAHAEFQRLAAILLDDLRETLGR